MPNEDDVFDGIYWTSKWKPPNGGWLAPREWAKSNCDYNDPKRISSCHFHSFAIQTSSNDAESNSSVNGWWWCWCQMKRRRRQRHRQWTEQTRINETTWYQYAWLIMKMEKMTEIKPRWLSGDLWKCDNSFVNIKKLLSTFLFWHLQEVEKHTQTMSLIPITMCKDNWILNGIAVAASVYGNYDY